MGEMSPDDLRAFSWLLIESPGPFGAALNFLVEARVMGA
jgi:hypothetical protein